jgi:AcrR family transcriptional regulator
MPVAAQVGRRPGRPRDEAIDTAILDATIDELIEHGFPGLAMEAVAARAGVAKTTVYRRWSCTDELALEAMSRLYATRVDTPANASAREAILLRLQAFRRVWTNPRYAALMRRAAADGAAHPQLYRDFRDRLIAPNVAALNADLRAAVDEGLIRRDVDLDWVRQLLVAPILAAALTHRDDRVTRAQVEFTVDTVLAGLRP